MDTDLIKQDYLDDKELTDNELLLLFKNIINAVLEKGEFENTEKAFYTYRNYTLIKIMILENGTVIPTELESKIRKVFAIECNFLKKESKVKIYLGSFLTLFSIGGYILFQNEFGATPIFFIVSVFLFGLLFLFRGINDLNRIKKSN